MTRRSTLFGTGGAAAPYLLRSMGRNARRVGGIFITTFVL